MRRVGLTATIPGVLVMGAVLTSLHVRAAGERIDVPIVPYSGKGEDYQHFRSHLLDWIQNITDEAPKPLRDTEYLRRLRVVDRPSDFAAEADLVKYWESSDALEVFRGDISLDSPGRYYVRSRVYLGGLRGKLASSSILIEEPYSARDYADTKDSHLAVVFYGLAMDAERVDPSQRALIAQLLGVARAKLRDIKRRKAHLPPELADLDTAITDAISRLKSEK